MMRIASRGENAAWKQLRARRAEGFAFRREQEIGRYRADFVCLRRRVIVEVDGGVHDLPGRRERDAARDAWLQHEGYVVLRFAERVVLSEANWLQDVRALCQSRSEAPYRRRTLPLEGGGQGGGEIVERDATELSAGSRSSDVAFPPLPPAPSPSRGGRARGARGSVEHDAPHERARSADASASPHEARTLPLEGGGQGGGEIVECDVAELNAGSRSSDVAFPPLPPALSPSRGGRE